MATRNYAIFDEHGKHFNTLPGETARMAIQKARSHAKNARAGADKQWFKWTARPLH